MLQINSDANHQGISYNNQYTTQNRHIMRRVCMTKMYIRDAKIDVMESRLCEFKALTKSRSPIADIDMYVCRNVVAFLNTIEVDETATLYFGVEDSGKIIGTLVAQKEYDIVQNAVWDRLSHIEPKLTGTEYDMHMVLMCSGDGTVIPSLYVVELQIKKAFHPIYFYDNVCWVRRPAGVIKIEGPQLIDIIKARRARWNGSIELETDIQALQNKSLEELTAVEDTITGTLCEVKQLIRQRRSELVTKLKETRSELDRKKHIIATQAKLLQTIADLSHKTYRIRPKSHKT